jgi:hypothetical protein
MNSFEELFVRDVAEVFLNPDEFAETHDVNGAKILCVISSDVVSAAPGQYVGEFQNVKKLYVSVDDMEEPVRGQILTIDGSRHTVQDVSNESGMYVITVQEYLE